MNTTSRRGEGASGLHCGGGGDGWRPPCYRLCLMSFELPAKDKGERVWALAGADAGQKRLVKRGAWRSHQSSLKNEVRLVNSAKHSSRRGDQTLGFRILKSNGTGKYSRNLLAFQQGTVCE